MNETATISLIDRCTPLEPLPLEIKKRLAAVTRETRFRKGERLISIANPIRRILILLEGRVKLVGITEEGIERILYVYQPCEIIGSRFLLDDSIESHYEAIAMEPVLALTIPRAEFIAISRAHSELIEAVTQVLLERIDRLSTWMFAAVAVDASTRLMKLLLDLAERDRDLEFVPLSYSPTHETLAQIIGASRPHTTTLLRRLEEEGIVRRLKPRGLLVSPKALKRKLREAGTGMRATP